MRMSATILIDTADVDNPHVSECEDTLIIDTSEIPSRTERACTDATEAPRRTRDLREPEARARDATPTNIKGVDP